MAKVKKEAVKSVVKKVKKRGSQKKHPNKKEDAKKYAGQGR